MHLLRSCLFSQDSINSSFICIKFSRGKAFVWVGPSLHKVLPKWERQVTQGNCLLFAVLRAKSGLWQG